MGFLGATQFVTRKHTSAGILNTADLFGAVFGIAVAATVCIPLFGVLPVAAGLCVIKIAVGIGKKMI